MRGQHVVALISARTQEMRRARLAADSGPAANARPAPGDLIVDGCLYSAFAGSRTCRIATVSTKLRLISGRCGAISSGCSPIFPKLTISLRNGRHWRDFDHRPVRDPLAAASARTRIRGHSGPRLRASLQLRVSLRRGRGASPMVHQARWWDPVSARRNSPAPRSLARRWCGQSPSLRCSSRESDTTLAELSAGCALLWSRGARGRQRQPDPVQALWPASARRPPSLGRAHASENPSNFNANSAARVLRPWSTFPSAGRATAPARRTPGSTALPGSQRRMAVGRALRLGLYMQGRISCGGKPTVWHVHLEGLRLRCRQDWGTSPPKPSRRLA